MGEFGFWFWWHCWDGRREGPWMGKMYVVARRARRVMRRGTIQLKRVGKRNSSNSNPDIIF